VSWPQALLVFIAGIAAGTINTVVGSGTLITFPVLLGIGLSPVSANVSNTLGLAPGSLVGAYGYRAELTGQRRRVIVLGSASLTGGVIGAVLLLVLPASAFKSIVPVLVGLALVLVIIGPRLSKRMARGNPDPAASISVGLWLATMGTGIYGGYFGAAQGVLLVGLLGVLLRESLQRVNAIKNVLAGLVNLVAAIIFMFTAHMNYQAAGLIAAGSILGGLLGARIGRRLPSPVLRSIIVVVGIVAIVKLLI
jgi:uncharacterized membrane protein YfcA